MKTKKTSRGANGNGGSKWCTRLKRLSIYLRDGFACAYCGRDLHGADPAEITLDHLVAGHADHREVNLVTACRSCNSSRQDRPWRSYASGGAIERIVAIRRRSIARFRRLASAILKTTTTWGDALVGSK